MMGLRRIPPRSQGQALVLASILLAFVVVPLGLMVLAVNQERSAYAAVAALVRTAATDGAGVLADPSVATATPTLAGNSASCAESAGGLSAAGRACQTLRTGLAHLFPGPYARVDVPPALAATQVAVLNGTPAAPVQDPATGQVYHYPTLCVATRLWVGVLEYDGAGATFAFHACAQTAWRTTGR
jgi:hypothetical protein